MDRRSNNRQDNQISNDKNSQRYSYQYSTRPIKSPSPDRKPTNIIISTKSPELSQYKRESIPSHGQETPKPDNQYPQFTSSFKANQTYETSKKQERGIIKESRVFTSLGNSRLRNIKIEIAADYPDEFDAINNSSVTRQKQYSQTEYQRMLKSKDDTIRQLKSIIQLIKRNNHNSNIIVQQDPSKYQQMITQLNNDVKELKIQNQYLLKVIEKSKYMSGDNNKEVILERQIRELRESLRYKDLEIEQTIKNWNKLRKDYEGLEKQNFSLLKILKQREQNQNKHSQDKDKLSLIKIKQQHQQNLRITNQLFHSQIKNIEQGFFSQIDELNRRLQSYNQKINRLEYFRYQYEARNKNTQNIQNKNQEDYQQKERHRQIQSILLSKTTRYEKQINYYKNLGEEYSKELQLFKSQYDKLLEKYQKSSGKLKTDESAVLDKVKVRQEYEELQQKYKKLKETNDFLNHHNKQLDKQYALISQKYNQQLNEIGYLTRQQIQTSDDTQRLTATINRLQDQNNYLRQQFKNKNKADLDASFDKINQLLNQNQNLIKELTKLKYQNKDLQEKYNRNQSQIAKVKSDLSQSKEDSANRIENFELKNKNKNLENQLQNLQKLLKKQKQLHETQLLRFESKLQVLSYDYQNNLKQQKRKNQQIISTYQRKLLQERSKLQLLNEQTDKDRLDTQTKMRRAFELYDQQIQTLKEQVNKKNQQIYNLNILLQRSKKQNQSKQSYIQELQQIHKQYDNLKYKCNILQSNIGLLQKQIIQLDSNLNLKNQQTRRLTQENKHLNEIVPNLRQQLNRYIRQLKQKQITSNEVNHLKIQINQYLIEINHYNLEISKLKQENYYLMEKEQEKDKEYNDQFNVWRKAAQEKDRKIEELNGKLKVTLDQVQQKNRDYNMLFTTYEAIQNQRKKVGSLQNITLEQQLKQLKKYIQDYLYNKLQHIQSIQDYYKLTNSYEIKIQENNNLLKTIQQLKSEVMNGQKEKLLLSQKISFLQSNILIYERQLKERKQLYEQLLLEKIRMEKDLFLSRRVKIDNSNIEEKMRTDVSNITQKIDRLLEIERERNKKINNVVEQTSKVVTISRSNIYKSP